MYYYPSLSFILPLRHIFVILSQLFHSSHSFTEKKSYASNFFFFFCNLSVIKDRTYCSWHSHVAVLLS